MYCSVKFLSPIVTDGLPLPGCDDACEPVDVEPPPSSEPHAASERASAAAIRAAMLRNQVRVVTGSSSWGWLRERRLRGHPAGGVGLQFGVVHASAQATGGHQPLEAGEERIDGERQHGDADRRADDALEL